MSRFDDESENDFNSPEDTDPTARELRTEIVRLEAKLDQLTASARERAAEFVAISVRAAELETALSAARDRQQRDTKLLLLAWLMVAASLGLSLYTYFTS